MEKRRVCLKRRSERRGYLTGRTRKIGPTELIEVEFGPGDREFVPWDALAEISGSTDLAERFARGLYSGSDALRRLLAFVKIDGSLSDVVYSMESARADFYARNLVPGSV